MIAISFTSGQILEIQELLYEKAEECREENQQHLAYYFDKMGDEFCSVISKLNELPGEKRVANLVLAAN